MFPVSYVNSVPDKNPSPVHPAILAPSARALRVDLRRPPAIWGA